ncbi:MAG: polysaccharide biosynthesis/export family protein [Candidatus Latescibacteria bacterium]|nr:polysaccharide biosynthesis/export family protein [Candidatus Latescibacterota bacterium]
MNRRTLCLLAVLLLAIATMATAQAPAGTEEPLVTPVQPPAAYRLGSGDVVQLNVLQQPTLDRSLTVRPDGTAVVPLVGEVQIAGLTMREAEQLVREKLRLFNREISDVSLTVMQYNALRVYILGSVANPGSYTFQTAPTLWDVLRAAGGPAPDANLTQVRVVAEGTGETMSSVHDVSGIITGSGTASPVALNAGDTVIVPGSAMAQVAPARGVQVFGGVAAPGTYLINEPTRLMTVLMLAGAPIETGDLKKVWWVHSDEQGRYTSRPVDLVAFLQRGDLAGNPRVYPGDTVQVPQHSPGFFRTYFPILLGTISTAAAVSIALTRLN